MKKGMEERQRWEKEKEAQGLIKDRCGGGGQDGSRHTRRCL